MLCSIAPSSLSRQMQRVINRCGSLPRQLQQVQPPVAALTPEPPPPPPCPPSLTALCQTEALEDALRELHVLDTIDGDGVITALGGQMVALPLEPRLARMLLAARHLACLPDALTVAAMLSAENVFAFNRQVKGAGPQPAHPARAAQFGGGGPVG